MESSQFHKQQLSAPASPTSYINNSFPRYFFHSAPSSPITSCSLSSFVARCEAQLDAVSRSPADSDDSEFDDANFSFNVAQSYLSFQVPHHREKNVFKGDKIPPLKPPPGLQSAEIMHKSPLASPKSTGLSVKQIVEDLGLKSNKDFDPFTIAIQKIQRRNSIKYAANNAMLQLNRNEKKEVDKKKNNKSMRRLKSLGKLQSWLFREFQQKTRSSRRSRFEEQEY